MRVGIRAGVSHGTFREEISRVGVLPLPVLFPSFKDGSVFYRHVHEPLAVEGVAESRDEMGGDPFRGLERPVRSVFIP